jgi:hypothetical protein
MRPLFRTCMALYTGYRLRRSAHSLSHLVHYSARPALLGSTRQMKLGRG